MTYAPHMAAKGIFCGVRSSCMAAELLRKSHEVHHGIFLSSINYHPRLASYGRAAAEANFSAHFYGRAAAETNFKEYFYDHTQRAPTCVTCTKDTSGLGTLDEDLYGTACGCVVFSHARIVVMPGWKTCLDHLVPY